MQCQERACACVRVCEQGRAGERDREHACARSPASPALWLMQSWKKTNTFADQGDVKHAAAAAAPSALSSRPCCWLVTSRWTRCKLAHTQTRGDDGREMRAKEEEWEAPGQRDETGIRLECFESNNVSVTFCFLLHYLLALLYNSLMHQTGYALTHSHAVHTFSHFSHFYNRFNTQQIFQY